MDTWCYVCLDECMLRAFLQNTTKVQHLNWHSFSAMRSTNMPCRFFAKAVIATIVVIGFHTYLTDCAPLQHPLGLRMVLRMV